MNELMHDQATVPRTHKPTCKRCGDTGYLYSFTPFVHTNATALRNTILHCEVVSYKVLTSIMY